MGVFPGRIIPTPDHGHRFVLGLETTVRAYGRFPSDIVHATAYRHLIGVNGRFLTCRAGHPTVGTRRKPDPADRFAPRLVR